MNLRLLRELDTHESRTELITALDKLKWLLINKAREMCDSFPDYLVKLGVESKCCIFPYEDGPDFINISINPYRMNIVIRGLKWPDRLHVKVPVEIAERLLVLGMP